MDILGLVDVPLWLMLVLTLLLLLYVYGTWNHSVWVSQGVPGPKPWPLLGNTRELHRKCQYTHAAHYDTLSTATALPAPPHRRHQKRYYQGVRPVLAITDLDMVQEVMLKQFSNFSERNVLRGGSSDLLEKSIFMAWGPTWKRIRGLMTPAFTGVKLKLMSHYVNRCSDLLAKNIERKASSGELIDVKHMSQAFTLDVIAGTGFGLETNSLSQEDEPFTRHCRELFANVSARGLMAISGLVNSFPFLGPLPRRIALGRSSQFFRTALEKMVDERLERKKHPSQKSGKPEDILQMLTDSEADPELITTYDNSDETKNYRHMTREEIMAQGFNLLIAGFETTATTLQFLTYNLALHPHVQERIFEEIREQLGNTEPTYENVSQLKYLDAAIRESLRMFSPLGMVSRKAKEPVTIKGVHILANCGVTIPIYSILNDPEYFPNPEVFNPDRFLEENVAKIHPVAAELVFGYGPRKCIGMRLALLEIKTVAIAMLRRCRFVKCAETPDKVQLGNAFSQSMVDVVIKVKAELRSA